MMKIKSHKLHKGSRASPVRKDGLKKSLHASGSPRLHSSSRPVSVKNLSPGMKRSTIMPPGKSPHSPRMRSIASPPQRVRSLKRPKYEKRKMSPSPVRRDIPSSSHGMRGLSPYHDERYLNPRSSAHGSHLSSPPPIKKKARREPDRYERAETPSMMMRRSEMSMHSEDRMPHRSDMLPHSTSISSSSHRSHAASAAHDDRRDHYEMADRGHGGPPPVPSHSKRPPSVKSPYDGQHNERYRSPSPSSRYPLTDEKRYAPTLHERFSAVVDRHRTEPKIKYSREDLEKITIDIHRNLKAQSPTLRRIVDPSDVKLVRRANEGHRPMFDREEIKQAARDMREDAYYEKKATSGGGIYNSTHSTNLRDVENYEITRHRFETHHQAFQATSGRSLSDRWQNPESRKESTALDQDDREYERLHTKRSFGDTRSSKSGDMDFRSERYPAGETSRSRSDYPDSHHRTHSPDIEPRSLIAHRKEGPHSDARKKLSMRRDSDRELPPIGHSDGRSRYMPLSEKRYSDSLSRVEKHHVDHRTSSMELPHKWTTKRRSPMKEEKMSEFSRRPDKYAYKSWPEDFPGPPRNSSYYEGSHEGIESYRGRGSSRPFRGTRGLRSRGRGSFPSRSFYRGGYRNSNTFRGRGGSRRGRFSPGLWEHDLYSRSSEDRKIDLP
ncbi:serine/arginine repetitive matrix protein 2-like isoform X2 [Argiope bruennichi]|uniref:serine/arginine repetitive matrix protein 2-like isoform X2 n=1 Tax=Argiope bruennichi TaxID=94029 RepID=UPI00249463FD|nr:serine/arginine repetitive matrix protein 2-like isoform X2 [Argiope bruennichi]